MPLYNKGPKMRTFGSYSVSALIDARECAILCGISKSLWYKLYSQGKTPDSVGLGRRRLWRRDDIVRWIECGCPDRERFAKIPC